MRQLGAMATGGGVDIFICPGDSLEESPNWEASIVLVADESKAGVAWDQAYYNIHPEIA